MYDGQTEFFGHLLQDVEAVGGVAARGAEGLLGDPAGDADLVEDVAAGLEDGQGCQMAKFDPFLSLDCARVEGVGAQSKERKGSNFAAQRSGAVVQKPEGPNT